MNRDDKMAECAPQVSPSMTAGIKMLKLDLKITGVAAGFASFDLVGKDAASKPHVKNKEIVIPRTSRDVVIEFDLDDGVFDLRFCEADPVWVSRTQACPASACSDPQIKLLQVKPEKLKIEDCNTEQVDLHYTLVLEGDGRRVLVDPIIKNDP